MVIVWYISYIVYIYLRFYLHNKYKMICRVLWRTVSNFRRKMYGIYYGRKEIRPIGELKLIYISLKIPPLPVCPVKGVHIT